MNEQYRDRIKTWAAILPFIIMAAGAWMDSRVQLATLTQRVDNLTTSNDRSIEVFQELAQSVNRLSESVARLEERTKNLEGRE